MEGPWPVYIAPSGPLVFQFNADPITTLLLCSVGSPIETQSSTARFFWGCSYSLQSTSPSVVSLDSGHTRLPSKRSSYACCHTRTFQLLAEHERQDRVPPDRSTRLISRICRTLPLCASHEGCLVLAHVTDQHVVSPAPRGEPSRCACLLLKLL